ncbi:hypothetical protein [Haliangium sp.]|uniref:hypothetical protein n=1 Tax=Haliangium sp. TaxID=2663208 RepID=UPI003D108F35
MVDPDQRRRLVGGLEELAGKIPVFRLTDEDTWRLNDAGAPIFTVMELGLDELISAHGALAEPDKQRIDDGWDELLTAVTAVAVASRNAHAAAQRVVLALGPAPDSVKGPHAGTPVVDDGHRADIVPVAATLAAAVTDIGAAPPATAIESNPDEGDVEDSMRGMEIYAGPMRVRRWQAACGVMLAVIVLLAVQATALMQYDRAAASERIPLPEIQSLETKAFELSLEEATSWRAEDAAGPVGVAVAPPVVAMPEAPAGAEFTDGAPHEQDSTAESPAQPAANAETVGADLASEPTKRRSGEGKRIVMRQRVAAAGSIEHLVIVPPADSGKPPISVSVRPYAPRRSETTTDTVRRIDIPDTTDLLDLQITVPHEVLDPTGQSSKSATLEVRWRAEYKQERY